MFWAIKANSAEPLLRALAQLVRARVWRVPATRGGRLDVVPPVVVPFVELPHILGGWRRLVLDVVVGDIQNASVAADDAAELG